MKLVPYEKDKIPGKRKYSDIRKRLNEFAKSEFTCVEVMDFTHVDAKSCASSFAASAKKAKLFHIHAVMRKGRVFLVKDL